MENTNTKPQGETLVAPLGSTPMIELPDGSGCFTATILSHDEAMALPPKDRPICYRISSEMYHAVFEAVGESSMQWNPRPTGVFDAEKASDVALRLCFKIAEELERNASSSNSKLTHGFGKPSVETKEGTKQ